MLKLYGQSPLCDTRLQNIFCFCLLDSQYPQGLPESESKKKGMRRSHGETQGQPARPRDKAPQDEKRGRVWVMVSTRGKAWM